MATIDDIKIGDRVITAGGDIGHIEEIDRAGFCDVRCLTPRNVPSCVIVFCSIESVTKVSDAVVPMPRSKEWHRQAKSFQRTVANAFNTLE